MPSSVFPFVRKNVACCAGALVLVFPAGSALAAPVDVPPASDAPRARDASPVQDALPAVEASSVADAPRVSDAPSGHDAAAARDALSVVDASPVSDAPPVRDARPVLGASPVVDAPPKSDAPSAHDAAPVRDALPVQNASRVLEATPVLEAASLREAATAVAASPADEHHDPGAELADFAEQYVGAPYRFGGASPAGFDCTGFVMWVYAQFGVSLPHNEAGQLASGERVSADDLQPGDVLVFANTYRAGLSHTGIYVGNGQFVHAANERTGVIVSALWDGYWGPRLVGAARALA